MDNRDGSITIFMTFAFLLLFALTGTALDSARFFSSRGYVKTSAYGAEVAMYGNYNRELYEEYGLFAYGGYDGLGEKDWCEQYQEILLENLAERPRRDGQQKFSGHYASVYQLSAISVSLKKAGYLTQEGQFLKQLKSWTTVMAYKDITQKLINGIQGTDKGGQQELLNNMEEGEQVEAIKEEQRKARERAEENGEGTKEAQTANETEEVENPLEFLKELLRDGVLSLVCDEGSLAETEVKRRGEGESPQRVGDWHSKGSGTKILKGLLKQSETMWNDEMLVDQGKKGKLLVYVSQMFQSYVSEGDSSVPYGLEYMISAQTNQKDAFAAVVNRLFLIRTLLNFLYVEKDPSLQAASLETATAIAAVLTAEPLIPVIQKGILLVLSLEEACVDIYALLEGRRVPVLKDKSTFKMNYAQICSANKGMFRAKAQGYEMVGDGLKVSKLSKGMGYIHYLWLFLLMEPWEQLYQRSLDIMEYDLRERYNQTFTIDNCICDTKAVISYGLPLLSGTFLVKGTERVGESGQNAGIVMQKVSVAYGYQ